MRNKYLLTALLWVGGCASMYNEKAEEDLTRRAAFDLGCEGVDFTPLEETQGIVMTYGVRGCGRKATYVRAPTGAWVLNVVDGEPVAGDSSEAK